MGSSPSRKTPLLGIVNLVVGKYISALEVHTKVSIYEDYREKGRVVASSFIL